MKPPMLSLIAALTALTQPAPEPPRPGLGRTAWIVATVHHSEWCPAGNVRLDLVTGRYQFTAGVPRPACTDRRIERPVVAGTLAGPRLAAVRAAFLRAVAEGVTTQTCLDGRRPEQLVITNGGVPVLLLTTGRATLSAPDELGCWTRAANALHQALERVFPSRGRR